MKTILAYFGGFVVVLAVVGFFGVGHFSLIYSPDKLNCKKVVA